MTQREIAAALQRYAEAKNRRDVEATLDCCAEDCYYETVAVGNPVRGKEALREYYTQLFDGMPDYYGDFDGHAFADGVSVSWGRFGGTSSGHVNGIPVEKGRKIELPVVFVCEWRDGLVASDRGWFDVMTFFNQAGISPGRARGEAPARAESADAAFFLDGFRRLWEEGDSDAVSQIIAPDATLRWPAFPPVRGSDYPQFLRTLAELIPGVEMKVTASASQGDVLFISWEAVATVGDERVEWSGMDRFRLRGRQAIDGLIAFDPTPMREAMEKAGVAVPAAVPAGT